MDGRFHGEREVTVLEVAPEIMGAEDSDAAALLREIFKEDAGQRNGARLAPVQHVKLLSRHVMFI